MLKRGLDQWTAWVLAALLAGLVVAGVAFLAKISAARYSPDEALLPPSHAGAHTRDEHAAAVADESGRDEAPSHASEAQPQTPAAVPAADQPLPWNYQGSTGPDHWASLAPTFSACTKGARQSPVDIDETTTNAKLLPIKFHYKADDAIVVNDGRAVSLRLPTGNYVEIDGERFDLIQLRWHAPSEHKVAGVPYDMELQLEHKNVDGDLITISVMFEEGEVNAALRPIWSSVPRERGEAPEPIEVDPGKLLPAKRVFYTYSGSLTAPPCTEGVRWFVLTQPLSVSAKQVDQLVSLVPFNARPVQPLHGRKVSKSSR